MNDAHIFEGRLRRLERTNRLLVAGLLLVAGGAVAWRPAQPDRLQLRSLEIVDDDGRTRARLAHDAEGTALYLIDAEGSTRAGVAHFAHGGSGVALHGPEGRGAAVLYLKGEGSLTFYGSEGEVLRRVAGGGGG